MDSIRPPGLEPLPGPSSAPRHGGAGQASETAREFEAVFLGQMVRVMLESVEMDDGFSGGHGEEIFRGILAERIGTEMTQNGGIGLAPMVLDHMLRLQGNSHDQ